MSRKFRKANFLNSELCGVCAGFAYFAGWPVWSIRILFILCVLFLPFSLGGLLIVSYILLAIFLPRWNDDPEDFDDVTGD